MALDSVIQRDPEVFELAKQIRFLSKQIHSLVIDIEKTAVQLEQHNKSIVQEEK